MHPSWPAWKHHAPNAPGRSAVCPSLPRNGACGTFRFSIRTTLDGPNAQKMFPPPTLESVDLSSELGSEMDMFTMEVWFS